MNRKIIIILMILLSGLLPASRGWPDPGKEGAKEGAVTAKPGTEKGPGPSSSPSPMIAEGCDIIFILDSSGSMKKTDPQDFRKPATELMVSLLGPKDRIGVIRFGDGAETLIPLTENRPENRKAFSKAIENISSKDLTTDLYGAVRKGFDEIKSSSKSNRILVLMSDGKMDLGSPEKDGEALKKLADLLPELTKNKIKIYSVAFTDLSDQKFLAELAERTGGIFGMAKTDKDLHVIFSSIFEQIKTPDTVPLEGDTFFVDKDIQEATILITKQTETSTRLIDPQGREVTYGQADPNRDWYQTRAFDLITLKKPVPGRWKVQLSSKEGNKIFILTDLTLKSSLRENQIYQGQDLTIDVWLEKENHRITEKKVLESLFVIAEIKEPAGTRSRINLYPRESEGKTDQAGLFSNHYLFKTPGSYTVQITVDGKTFKRELVHRLMVLPMPEVKVAPASGQRTKEEGAEAPSKSPWIRAFIHLGILNLVILLIAGLGYGGFWWFKKRPKKKK
jgi:hypothetical protein